MRLKKQKFRLRLERIVSSRGGTAVYIKKEYQQSKTIHQLITAFQIENKQWYREGGYFIEEKNNHYVGLSKCCAMGLNAGYVSRLIKMHFDKYMEQYEIDNEIS